MILIDKTMFFLAISSKFVEEFLLEKLIIFKMYDCDVIDILFPFLGSKIILFLSVALFFDRLLFKKNQKQYDLNL